MKHYSVDIEFYIISFLSLTSFYILLVHFSIIRFVYSRLGSTKSFSNLHLIYWSYLHFELQSKLTKIESQVASLHCQRPTQMEGWNMGRQERQCMITSLCLKMGNLEFSSANFAVDEFPALQAPVICLLTFAKVTQKYVPSKEARYLRIRLNHLHLHLYNHSHGRF